MISEEQQEQASLYALDLLSAEEATAFERTIAANPELQKLVDELRETAASLALAAPYQTAPPAGLKQLVLEQIATESAPTPRNIISFPRWIPWAIAAALAIFCGVLAIDRARYKQLADEQATRESSKPILLALAPTQDGPAKAEAVVAWQPATQSGILKIKNLPAAASGKDYQLWAVDADHKDPISAGIVRVKGDGIVEVEFKPTEAARHVKAFALSLEREGGVPKKEGPILLIGTV